MQEEIRLIERDGRTSQIGIRLWLTPELSESRTVNYQEISEMRQAGGLLIYIGTPARTYQLSARMVSRTALEADDTFRNTHILKGWTAPNKLLNSGGGISGGDGENAPEVLKLYAKHYETGEPMPDELIDKIRNSGHFNQGFATTEYLAASFLDMDWHTLTSTEEKDAIQFEDESLGKIGLIPEIVVRYRSPYFRHIFSGGYSSGYYGYVWAEVVDADAFQAFEENGIFDQKTAQSFRENILSRGGTEDPMELYKKFRGAEPKIDAYLERKGLN